MRFVTALVLVTTLAMLASTTSAAPPSIVTQGSGAARACAGCHGVDGAGNAESGVPLLAGLPEAYLTKQIEDFKSGARSNPIMAPIAQALSAGDTESAAKYYASLERPKTKPAAADPEVLARGETLATGGAWERNVPACFKCHGEGGRGVAPHFPPLAGQHASYVSAQMKAWRDGARRNDPQQLMKALTDKLTDEEIEAVSQYIASLGGDVPAKSTAAPTKSSAGSSAPASAKAAPEKFEPPPESAIPKNEFGEMVLLGKNIFVNTQQYAKEFLGNGLNCTNCHLNNGRKPDSAPLWAAYVLYPAYRQKTRQVDTIQSRIQGCFMYSMNGKPPAADSKVMTALVTYHYWLATGAPTGVKLPGQGFLNLPKPPKTPDLARGAEVYKKNCVICHGANGEGTKSQGSYVFPPLWGNESFNWGAGMHRINTAAGFIKANMPYGRGGTLSDQEAWDVALYMNSHDRPADPRFEGSIEQTRDKEHDENCLYGRTPEELAAYLEKKEKAEAAKKAKEAKAKKPQQGMSPATAH